MVKGFFQTQGVDFDQIFRAVVNYEFIRVFFAIFAQEDMKLFQFDIKISFLNGELNKEI